MCSLDVKYGPVFGDLCGGATILEILPNEIISSQGICEEKIMDNILVNVFLVILFLAGGLTRHLWLEGEFDDQFHYILRNEMLSDEDEAKSYQVVSDLNYTLNRMWPGTVVTTFGSIAIRVALRSSDIDVLATLPGSNNKSDNALVMDALDLLAAQPDLYTECSLRPSRIPIISFLHVKTHMHGDLCLKLPSAIDLSDLLKYLINSDPRIREVTIFVKFWSMTHSIIGSQKLRSSAVYFLTLFYFQQKHMLPAIAQMHNNSAPINFRGYNFSNNLIPFNSSNSESIYELLAGFFRYYREFDFDNYFVSPFVGRPVSKRAFSDVETIPAEFTLYKQQLREHAPVTLNTEPKLVIQDAFLHGNNVAQGLGDNIVNDEIISYIERAANAFDEVPPNEVLCAILRTDRDVERSSEEDGSSNKYCVPST